MRALSSPRTFLLWAAAAAGLSLLALGLGAGGLLLLLVLGFAAWTRDDRDSSLGGALAGASVLAFALAAWLGLGQERVCAPYELGALVSCTSLVPEQSAWPWLLLGVVLVAAGLGLALHRRSADVDVPTSA